MRVHENCLKRTELSENADITVLSPGGMASTYILDVLQKFPDLRVRKRHPLTKEVLFKPQKQKIVYVYNDPLLAILSRFRRNLLFSGWALNERSKSYHLKELPLNIREEFLAYGAFLVKPQNQSDSVVGRLPRKYEHHFTKRLLEYTNHLNEDLYGIENHFNEAYKLKKDFEVVFIDIRDPKASVKLSKFVNKNITLTQLSRRSNYRLLDSFLSNNKNMCSMYANINKKITKLIYK